jgi:ribosomal protein S18 acetylase RimI-like enzyme
LSLASLYHLAIKTKIREAKLTDTAIVADFNARMALETEQRRLDIERVRKGVHALLGDPAKGAYLIAETEANGAISVVGQLLITYEWSDWRNGNFWWIQSVYVEEKYRGQGIFRALFNHVEQLAKARKDVCGLRLYVDADNHSARKTYERLGMKRTNYELFEADFVLQDSE